MANRGCNLECVVDKKGGDGIVEFVGPVKIVLVDQPKSAYRNKTWTAAFITLAQILMGSATLLVLFYTLTYNKKTYLQALHIWLCTIGFQLSLPTGVLTLNSLSGISAQMTPADRKFEHAILQIFSVIIVISGTVAAFCAGYPSTGTLHCLLGLIAGGLTLINVIVGIIVYVTSLIEKKYEICRILHKIFLIFHHILGILTIIASSICFVSGIMKDSFKKWLPLVEMYYSLFIFCFFYTIIVIYKPVRLYV